MARRMYEIPRGASGKKSGGARGDAETRETIPMTEGKGAKWARAARHVRTEKELWATRLYEKMKTPLKGGTTQPRLGMVNVG